MDMQSHMKLQQDELNLIKKTFFSWKCTRKNRKIRIENTECELKVNNISIKKLKLKYSARTLVFHVCPQLLCDEKFKVMKEKMIKSIAKLNKTEIKLDLMCLCFKTHFLKRWGLGVD